MREVGKLATDVSNITKEPVKHIHIVAELSKERATVKCIGSVPAAFLIVFPITVPESVNLYKVYITKCLVLNKLLKPNHWW